MRQCACTAPVEGAYVCDRCADTYARALDTLGDWLAEELEVSLSGAKGVRYRAGLSRGGSADTGLRVNYAAAELSRRLTGVLTATVVLCSKPGDETPATIEAMAEWLHWRVDALCRHPKGQSLMPRLEGLVARAERVVDRPPDHQYLGPCEACGRGSVYAQPDTGPMAKCNLCAAEVEADERRATLLNELDDRLVTVAEAARLSTYLDLRADRETVRKRINMWRVRGLIARHDGVAGDDVLVRFGEVSTRLLAAEVK